MEPVPATIGVIAAGILLIVCAVVILCAMGGCGETDEDNR